MTCPLLACTCTASKPTPASAPIGERLMNPRAQAPAHARGGTALRLGQCRAPPWLAAPAARLHRRPARRLKHPAPAALASDGSDGVVVCLGEALFGGCADCRRSAWCLASALLADTLVAGGRLLGEREGGPAGAGHRLVCLIEYLQSCSCFARSSSGPACACLAGPPSPAVPQRTWQQRWPSWACAWRL